MGYFHPVIEPFYPSEVPSDDMTCKFNMRSKTYWSQPMLTQDKG